MNNRFKSRFWLFGSKKMLEVIGLEILNDNIWLLHGRDHLLNYAGDDYELMQCTGVKDADGKDIYEGDIIQVSSRIGDWCDCIIWDNEYFQWWVGCSHPLKDIDSKNKVIGNIYENPELLK